MSFIKDARHIWVNRPSAHPVQVVPADVQGAPWTGTVVHCRPLPTSHISRQQTETAIRHLWRPRGLLHCHTLCRSCIRCVRPKGLESVAGALTGTRDSWLLQDGIEDLSSLHPVVAANCLDVTCPCNDFRVTARYKLSALLLLLYITSRFLCNQSWQRGLCSVSVFYFILLMSYFSRLRCADYIVIKRSGSMLCFYVGDSFLRLEIKYSVFSHFSLTAR